MPPYTMVTKDHLKQVLAGRKVLLKMTEVSFCNPPTYDELSVKGLYDKVIKQTGMSLFFPDRYPKGRQCERAYMFNIWNTKHPHQVAGVIQHANKQRYAIDSEKVKQDTIIMTEHWRNELESMPFVSKQKGRMCALLKQKSKIGVLSKPRKQYETFDFTKKYKHADGTVEEIKQNTETTAPDDAKIKPKPKRGTKLLDENENK